MGNRLEYFQRLGAMRSGDGVQFAVSASQESAVSLLLYRKGKEEVEREIPFEEDAIGDVRFLFVGGLEDKEYEYNYYIDGNVVQDPCAEVLAGDKSFGTPLAKEKIHSVRCGFPWEKYDWQQDVRPNIAYEDAIMYNLHVRGFTKQAGSGVKHKGTFLGIAEKVEYLSGLGINQVKLMPAYEFNEIIEKFPGMQSAFTPPEEALKTEINYWGYTEGYYFAPNRAYAATSDVVKEFKDMVKVLHAHGIEVIMEIYFPPAVNPRMIPSCLIHWMQAYHVDGFHLMGDQNLFNYIAKDPLFSTTKLLGIYFPVNEIYPSGRYPKRKNLAECNDCFQINMRKLLKSEEDQLNQFVSLIKKNPAGSGVINYITNHDGFTLQDLVSYDEKHNEANGENNRDGNPYSYSWNCGVEGPTKRKKILELRQRQMKNAFLLMLLSQGTPMLLAGDEFGNSQDGNNNPYCQDNEITWLDWKATRRNAKLLEFVKETIAFRKRHKILHMPTELLVMDSLSCGYPDVSYHGNRAWYGAFENVNRQIGVMYCGEYAGEDCFLYVAYNLHWIAHEFALPNLQEDLQWRIAIHTEDGVYREGEEPELAGQKMFTVPARTIVVLIGRK